MGGSGYDYLDPEMGRVRILKRGEILGGTGRRKVTRYIPTMPLEVIGITVAAGAEKALPVVLAAWREAVMARDRTVELRASVWRLAGVDTRRKRDSVFAALRLAPESIATLETRPGRPALLHFGPAWYAPGSTSGEAAA
jgi:hypothetical protein